MVRPMNSRPFLSDICLLRKYVIEIADLLSNCPGHPTSFVSVKRNILQVILRTRKESQILYDVAFSDKTNRNINSLVLLRDLNSLAKHRLTQVDTQSVMVDSTVTIVPERLLRGINEFLNRKIVFWGTAPLV